VNGVGVVSAADRVEVAVDAVDDRRVPAVLYAPVVTAVCLAVSPGKEKNYIVYSSYSDFLIIYFFFCRGTQKKPDKDFLTMDYTDTKLNRVHECLKSLCSCVHFAFLLQN
jgi:hypothetical protein